MARTLSSGGTSKPLAAFVAAAMAFSVALPAQALTVEQAYAADDKPHITLTSGSTIGIQVGKKINLKSKVNVTKGAKITYTSSKKSIATVSSKGVVTAKKAGKVTIAIKAKKGSKIVTKKVTVKVEKAAKPATAKKAVSASTAVEQPALNAGPAIETAAPEIEAVQPNAEPIAESQDVVASSTIETSSMTAETSPTTTVWMPAPASSSKETYSSTAEAPAQSNSAASGSAASTGGQGASTRLVIEASASGDTGSAGASLQAGTLKQESAVQSEAASSSTSTSASRSSQPTATTATTAPAAKNGFVTENGKTYYYKDNAKTYGWITVNGSKYYANTSTGVLASGWLRLSDGDRYFDPAAGGKMVTGRFRVPHAGGSNWYYFDGNGVRLANVLRDGYYYRASDGVMVAGAWQRFSDGDRFFKSDGSMAKGVYTVNFNGSSATYYFNGNGIRMADTIQGGFYFRAGDGIGFKIAKLNSGTYEILSALGGGQRLDVAAGGLDDTANVQTYAQTNTNAQVWQVTPAGGDYYTIVNVNSGKALDVQGGGKANGTNVFQYVANGTDAQKWMPLSYAGGVVLVNKASGKALDVAGAACGNGANVQSFEMNWTTAQVWRFSAQAQYPFYICNTAYNTRAERDTALSTWNAYNEFRARKGVPQVAWSDECARIAQETCYAESRIGKMQHEIAIPADKHFTYSDILQYATWRKAGASVIDRWEQSEGHHRMMRNNNGTTQAGVGVYFDGTKWWYTIVYNFSGCNQYQGALW